MKPDHRKITIDCSEAKASLKATSNKSVTPYVSTQSSTNPHTKTHHSVQAKVKLFPVQQQQPETSFLRQKSFTLKNFSTRILKTGSNLLKQAYHVAVPVVKQWFDDYVDFLQRKPLVAITVTFFAYLFVSAVFAQEPDYEAVKLSEQKNVHQASVYTKDTAAKGAVTAATTPQLVADYSFSRKNRGYGFASNFSYEPLNTAKWSRETSMLKSENGKTPEKPPISDPVYSVEHQGRLGAVAVAIGALIAGLLIVYCLPHKDTNRNYFNLTTGASDLQEGVIEQIGSNEECASAPEPNIQKDIEDSYDSSDPVNQVKREYTTDKNTAFPSPKQVSASIKAESLAYTSPKEWQRALLRCYKGFIHEANASRSALVSVRGARSHNEDFAVQFSIKGMDFMMVADGCAGHPGGELASCFAIKAASTNLIESAKKLLSEEKSIVSDQQLESLVREALHAASTELSSLGGTYWKSHELRTTLMILGANENKYALAWAGDGGCMVRRQSSGRWETVLVAHKGVNAKGEAVDNLLASSLGPTQIGSISVNTTLRMPGDQLYMGSDGIFDPVEDHEIFWAWFRDGLKNKNSPQKLMEQLVNSCSTNSAFDDNITAAFLDTPIVASASPNTSRYNQPFREPAARSKPQNETPTDYIPSTI